jgi:hypothetical protein
MGNSRGNGDPTLNCTDSGHRSQTRHGHPGESSELALTVVSLRLNQEIAQTLRVQGAFAHVTYVFGTVA